MKYKLNYCFNNPLIHTDPSGKKIKPFELSIYDEWNRELLNYPGYSAGLMRAMNPTRSFNLGTSEYSYNWNTGCYVNNETGNVASWGEVSIWFNFNYPTTDANGYYADVYKTYSGYNYWKKDEGNPDKYHYWSITVKIGQAFVWDTGYGRNYPNTWQKFDGSLLNSGGGVLGSVGAIAQESNATFRLTNSKGMFDWRWYWSGWGGNQWVTPTKVASVGKGLSWGATGLGAISLGIDGYQTFVTGNMSLSRFVYHAGTFGISLALYSNPLGLTAGVTLYGYEALYDKIVVPLHDFYWEFKQNLSNPDNIGYFFGY